MKHHNWIAAGDQFSRCSEIMTHANQSRDSSIANLYAGTCNFYSGDIQGASLLFQNSFKSLALSDPAKTSAYQFSLSALFELYLKGDQTAWPPSPEVPVSDPWIQLALNTVPVDGFPKQVWDFQESGTELADVPSDGIESEAVAWAHLRRAYTAVSKLPKANALGQKIDHEVKLVNLALKAGEKVRSLGDEHDIIGVWYVGNSLILRGRLFEFNANALMAEGMFRAAGDLVTKHSHAIPRNFLLSRMANSHLGDLLLRWEKREQEGQRLLDSNPSPNVDLINKSISTFSSLPQFESLDRLV